MMLCRWWARSQGHPTDDRGFKLVGAGRHHGVASGWAPPGDHMSSSSCVCSVYAVCMQCVCSNCAVCLECVCSVYAVPIAHT